MSDPQKSPQKCSLPRNHEVREKCIAPAVTVREYDSASKPDKSTRKWNGVCVGGGN